MTATITHTLGRFVWRELFTRDVEAAKRFYGGLFGWTFDGRAMGPDFVYTIVKAGAKEIAGIMDIADMPGGGDGIPPSWAVYVSVADVDAAAAIAKAEGGQVLGDCHDIPGVGRFAVLQDPQGGHFNLFRRSAGDAPFEAPQAGEFCWESLMTTDIPAAVAFYQKVVGWGTNAMPSPEGSMTLFSRKNEEGVMEDVASTGPAPEGMPAFWTTFVAVDQLEATAAKARELGGTVHLERMGIPDVGAFGVLQDPTGAMIYVFEPLKACGT